MHGAAGACERDGEAGGVSHAGGSSVRGVFSAVEYWGGSGVRFGGGFAVLDGAAVDEPGRMLIWWAEKRDVIGYRWAKCWRGSCAVFFWKSQKKTRREKRERRCGLARSVRVFRGSRFCSTLGVDEPLSIDFGVRFVHE